MHVLLSTSIALAAAGLFAPAGTAQERPMSPGRSRALESYAEAHGVTVGEAERRQRYRWEIVELGTRLKAEEAETFGGLYIEHSPAYRVVVQFTRDGAATLARYTRNPIFVPALAVISREALHKTHSRAMDLMRATGIQYVSSEDIRTGLINVYVAELAAVRRLQATGALRLPPRVVVHRVASMEPEWKRTSVRPRPANEG
jgi:hypothetical protein